MPIEETAGGWSAAFNERRYVDLDQIELVQLKRVIRDAGAYPFVGDPDEMCGLAG